MKSKWLLLTKIQLMGLFDFNKARYSKDTKTVRRTAGMAAVMAIVGLCICAYVVFFAVEFCNQGIGSHLPALLIALTSFITLLFSLLQGCSVLFAMKDYDHVMSLPVKKTDVLISRLVCIYLANLAFALPVVIPGTAVLFVMDGFSLAVLGVTLAGMIFSPLLPMAVAIALSTLLTALTARFRYKNVLQIILGVLLFLGVMIASFSFSYSSSAQETVDMNAVYSMLVGKIYLPALLIDTTLSGGVWGIFAFMGISLATVAVFVLIVALCFDRVHEALSARGGSQVHGTERARRFRLFRARQTGVQAALFRIRLLYQRAVRHHPAARRRRRTAVSRSRRPVRTDGRGDPPLHVRLCRRGLCLFLHRHEQSRGERPVAGRENARTAVCSARGAASRPARQGAPHLCMQRARRTDLFRDLLPAV